MGTPLGPKYIPYTYMDPLGECFSKSWPSPRHWGPKRGTAKTWGFLKPMCLWWVGSICSMNDRSSVSGEQGGGGGRITNSVRQWVSGMPLNL